MLHLRVLTLFCLGYYCCAGAALVLLQFGIDLFAFFGVPGRPRTVAGHVFQKANLLALVVVGGAATSATVNRLFGASTDVLLWATVALFFYLVLETKPLRKILARVARGGISSDDRVGDVLISDCLVSYASVFTDMALALSLCYSGQQLDRSTSPHPFVMLVASLPIGIRIKQCWHDFRRTGDKTHLLNLLKYFVSNIPNALRIQVLENPGLAPLLPWALTISTLYSLTWDLVFDWKLTDTARVRRFPTWWYTAAVAGDLVLRFAWTFHKPTEYRIFGLQTIEVLRRAVWVLFRVEHEPIVNLD